MIYLLNALLSCCYIYILRKNKKLKISHFIPIILAWTLILGLQYDVGTDYFSYVEIFHSSKRLDYYLYKREILFVYFIKVLKYFFNEAQFFFIFVALIENLLFYFYIKKMIKNSFIEIKTLYIYIFLFLCFGTNFYNQMNGIRQYFNIYLLSFITIYLYDRNFIKYNILFLIGTGIHQSFKLLYPIYFVKFLIERINVKHLKLIIFLGLILNFLPIKRIIRMVILYIPAYKGYLDTKYLKEIEFVAKIPKILFIFFYFDASNLLKKRYLNNKKIFMIKIGIISYAIRLFTLKLSLLTRIGEYFVMLSIYPIYVLSVYYLKKEKYIRFFILIMSVSFLFLCKVIVFPVREYLYKSCIFI